MNLEEERAVSQGVACITARRQYAAGMLPIAACRLGRLIMAGGPVAAQDQAGGVVADARVPSAGQRAGPGRQVARVTAWATGQRLAVSRVVTVAGPVLDGTCREFVAFLRDEPIVAGHGPARRG